MDQGRVVVWYLHVTPDRHVASPGEVVHVDFALRNSLAVPIYIADITWNTSFYDVKNAVYQEVRKVIGPYEYDLIAAGRISVPEVPDGQYDINTLLNTFGYDPTLNQWVDLGVISAEESRPIIVAHAPRYRAFLSRSLRNEDRPLGDVVANIVSRWGFDVHTVGVNELEADPTKVNQHVLEEILKSDVLFGICTPRDISAITGLVHTFGWLNSEATLAFATQKPLLLLVDNRVTLQGLPAGPSIAQIPYASSDVVRLAEDLNKALPIVREFIKQRKATELVNALRQMQHQVAYGAYIAGIVVQRRFPT